MPRTLGPILEISYDYLIHIVVWNHSLMCLVLTRYKTTTKIIVINNLDFGSISRGVGLSILISNLTKKNFFANFLFRQLSLVCFCYWFDWSISLLFWKVLLWYSLILCTLFSFNFASQFWIHSLVLSVHEFKDSLIRCRKRSICLQ